MSYSFVGLEKSYGVFPVIDKLDLDLERGDMTVILGPSGCGKTSLLRIIAGLDDDYRGKREGFDGCRFSFVFQEPRLLPWKSVMANILFALSGSGLGRAEATLEATRLLGLAGLDDFVRHRPSELSGGLRQRVALVRGFAYPADFLLLDEAFQSVDIGLRMELMGLFKGLREAEERTVLLVTHDPSEALVLADRVIILSKRPARVLDDFRIVCDEARRFPGSPDLAVYETRIYSALLGPGGGKKGGEGVGAIRD